MALPRRLIRAAHAAERLVERLSGRHRRVPRVIEPYAGLAGPSDLMIRGRVLSRLRRPTATAHQHRTVNAAQMLSLFLTREVAGVAVSAGGRRAVTDGEGYFHLAVPRAGRAAGWHQIDVTIDAGDDAAGDDAGGDAAPGRRFACPVLVPGEDARRIVISDIDDTVIETGAHSLLRNLWTSLTGNAATRRVFADSVVLLQHLTDDGRNPLCLVSSSPWNLHAFLAEVLERAGLPPAPMFLRDLGLSDTQFITGGHGDHKRRAIDTILAAVPDLPVVLIGDTGQHDAAIYRAAAARHPGRIEAIYLRRARREGRAVAGEIALLRDSAVPLVEVRDQFAPVNGSVVGSAPRSPAPQPEAQHREPGGRE